MCSDPVPTPHPPLGLQGPFCDPQPAACHRLGPGLLPVPTQAVAPSLSIVLSLAPALSLALAPALALALGGRIRRRARAVRIVGRIRYKW